MPTHPLLQRSVAVLLITGQLIGCTGWHVESLSPAEVVERQQPNEIRVQHGDGRREVLYQPEVRGDSLLGRQDPSAAHHDRGLALTDVKVVATRHVSAGRTAGLLLGIGVMVGVLVAVSTMQGPFDNWGQ
jgi:hypothetical protein